MRSETAAANLPHGRGCRIPAAVSLPFRRVVDVPVETAVAVLQNTVRPGHECDLHIGDSRIRGPVEHDRDLGACRFEVRLARGRLRPPLPMRLEVDRWTWPPSRTVLELIPGRRVRPTAAYFRAGHLLLDALTHLLLQHATGDALAVSPTGCGQRGGA